MKKNPLYFLRKYLPLVYRGEKLMVITMLNKLDKSVRYYNWLRKPTSINGIYVDRGIEMRKITLNMKAKHFENRYATITTLGGFIQFEPFNKHRVTDETINLFMKRQIEKYDYNDRSNEVYNIFPYNSIFLDTICITDLDGRNKQIVYDFTGNLDVVQKYPQQSRKWIGNRKLAERLYHPKFLQDRGYFDLTGNTDLVYPARELERLELLRSEPDSSELTETYRKQAGFTFGKRLSGKFSEIRYLRSLRC
jgi:hypothetical protein